MAASANFSAYNIPNGIALGVGYKDGKVMSDVQVGLPLDTLNRHGLIAGATGTGKTKSLQRFLERLSLAGVPSLVMDMKGDLSGIAEIGSMNDKIQSRLTQTGTTWTPRKFPVEFLTLGQEDGVRVRATVTEFGPILFSKILDLNETQSSVMSVLFKFADDQGLPLVDLKDMKSLLQYVQGEGKNDFESLYGKLSSATLGIILRNIVELEGQGAELFFGELSFDVRDLLQMDLTGMGVINVLRLFALQDKPKLFSTFMLELLSEVFATFPEVGDPEKPKLVICIDEAHLIFSNATKALVEQLQTVMKLIRSKGVGIVFITQSPDDIPESILGQLGFRIQHALRAFTAKDRQTMKLVAQNFPESADYDVEALLTTLGIGEALVTGLSSDGMMLPLVHTIITPPESRMDVLSEQEFETCLAMSRLKAKYNIAMDSDSAYEILARKMQMAIPRQMEEPKAPKTSTGDSVFSNPMAKSILKSATTSMVRNMTGQVTRGLMGALMKNIFGK